MLIRTANILIVIQILKKFGYFLSSFWSTSAVVKHCVRFQQSPSKINSDYLSWAVVLFSISVGHKRHKRDKQQCKCCCEAAYHTENGFAHDIPPRWIRTGSPSIARFMISGSLNLRFPGWTQPHQRYAHFSWMSLIWLNRRIRLSIVCTAVTYYGGFCLISDL